MSLLTINEIELTPEDHSYNYQSVLTPELDQYNGEFGFDHLNKVVLWKVNRFAEFDKKSIELINKIDPDNEVLDKKLTEEILIYLLGIKGVRFPTATTILRFRNPNIYQILDQRVYRLVYGKELDMPSYLSRERRDRLILTYFDYLHKLRQLAIQINVDFRVIDRVLYKADKRVNGKIKY